jgi:hypothetical protein
LTLLDDSRTALHTVSGTSAEPPAAHGWMRFRWRVVAFDVAITV